MRRITVLLTVLLVGISELFSQVAINNTGAPPNASAMLDVQSTNKGFYPPRMSWSQIKAIQSPGPGMVVFDLDFGKLRVYNGTKWAAIETDMPYDKPEGTSKVNPIFSELNLEKMEAVAVDPVSRNVYVTGATTGNIYGQVVNGISDGILVAYNEAGERLWARTFGSSSYDGGIALAVGNDGSVYVGADIAGSIDGQPYSGGYDIAIVKFNASGDKQWARALGTTINDRVNKIQLDPSGNAYLLAFTESAFPGFTNASGLDLVLTKFDENGNRLWLTQYGSASTIFSNGFFINSTGLFITGSAVGSIDGLPYSGGGSDIFVLKYDFTGTKVFSILLGTDGHDYGQDLVADANGNFFVTGITDGPLNGQTSTLQSTGFIIKYDQWGTAQWTKLYTDDAFKNFPLYIRMDSQGNLFVIGGKLPNTYVDPFFDQIKYIKKLDNNGNKIWTLDGGSDASNAIYGVSKIYDGSFYVLGFFSGNYFYFGNNRIKNTGASGTFESFLWRYAE
jgi:hypothetical protein